MDDRAQLNTLDSKILTPVVRRACGNESLELDQWTIQQIHGGGGEGVGIYRLTGQATNHGVLNDQWSLILKVLGRSEAALDLSSWGYWRREAEAYQCGFMNDLPAGLKTPRCFGVSEPADGIAWLWLEDVEQAKSSALQLTDYQRVAHQLGQFNGHYLTGQSAPVYPWLSRGWLRGWVELNASAVDHFSQSLDQRWIKRVWPRSSAEAFLQTWAERELYFRTLERLPQTLCHLDVFRRNLLPRSRPAGDHEMVIVDWSFVGQGALGEELVPLVVASIAFMEVDILMGGELEEKAFAGYLEGLHESGWRGDPQLVRLGYASAAALRYGVGVLRLMLPFLLDETLQPMAEQFWGRPFQVLCEAWSIVNSRFTLRLAEEARELMDKLGYG